ncbi:MAG TPA: DHH family phosphoesterase [Patescibacteria group bacterium]|nr:DHH family phosphoesterase [Patescibacteria group bacterium]
MQTYPEAEQIREIINGAQRIVILQADNPDGDSLGSALALEQILHEMGKEPLLYCGVDIPSYLSSMPGWDRVSKDLPQQFDASIIVDTSADSLFEQLQKSGQKGWVAAKPVILLDHHDVKNSIQFANVVCNYPVVATGEIIYELAKQLDWPLNQEAKEAIASSILSDSLGLTTDATTGRSIHIIGELVEGGVSIAILEQRRRELMRKSPELIKYKGTLLQRIEYYADNRVVTVTIPWAEIERYSPQYNPSMLVIDEMRGAIGAAVAIAFKLYNDGHVTAKIRANYGFPIAGKLAEHFGGGGHAYASGFKITETRPLTDIKAECITYATELLDNLEKQ